MLKIRLRKHPRGLQPHTIRPGEAVQRLLFASFAFRLPFPGVRVLASMECWKEVFFFRLFDSRVDPARAGHGNLKILKPRRSENRSVGITTIVAMINRRPRLTV